jgi:CheY-like chemotaxis protein
LTQATGLDSLPTGTELTDFDVVLIDGPEANTRAVRQGEPAAPMIVMVPPNSSVERNTAHRVIRLRKPLQEGPLLAAVCRALEIAQPPWLLADENTEFELADVSPQEALDQRVLVVEDNELNRRLSVEILRRRGYIVDTAVSGVEALELVAGISYSVILMDCQMPELDGYDAASAIRSFETDESRVPIIAVTAHAFGGERERCLTAGMDDFLAKPYFPDQLLDVVAKWAL